MSYFSLVHLEQEAQAAQMRLAAKVGAAYRDHQLLWRLFPSPDASRSFLFHRRIEESPGMAGAAPGLSYYVVSEQRPTAVAGLLRVQTKPYNPQLRPGQQIVFHLRANPSVDRTVDRTPPGGRAPGKDRPRSRRYDALRDAGLRGKAEGETAEQWRERQNQAAQDWLLSRAERCGLRIEPGTLMAEGYTQHTLQPRQRQITFSSIDYTGLAEVLDSAKLRTALLGGIGRERAFGCGLLMIRTAD